MRTRFILAAVILVLVSGTYAHASVLSASGQAVRNRPADRLDYLRVTSVQSDLNASLREMADESAATGTLSAPAPSVGGEGYFSYDIDGSGGVDRETGAVVLDPSGERASESGNIFRGPGGDGANWLPAGGRPGRDGTLPGNDRRPGNRPGNGGRKGGAHAAPEPSTWLLLGVGMGMLGTYAVIRRRVTIG